MKPLTPIDSETASQDRRVAELSARLAERLGSAPLHLFELCHDFDQAVEFAALEALPVSTAMAAFFQDYGVRKGPITAHDTKTQSPGLRPQSGLHLAGGCNASSAAAIELARLTGFGAPAIDTRALSLPVMPQQIVRLLRTSNESSSCKELENIAASDPVLAGRLVGTANSAMHGRFTITRLRDAVLHLGIPGSREILLASCLTGVFASKPLQNLWKHSQAVASAAGYLAHLCGIDPEVACLTGLLHDIGRLGLLKLSSNMNIREQEWTAAGFPVVYAETLAYGIDHAALGAQLLRDWALPEQIIEAVGTHHGLAHSQTKLGALLCLAEDLVARKSRTNSEDLWPALRRTAACRKLKIAVGQLDECMKDLISLASA